MKQLLQHNYHIGLYQEPVHVKDGQYDTYGAYARYVNEFARHFRQITVFAPTTTEGTYFSGHSLYQTNIDVVPLPFFMTHAQAYKNIGRILSAFRSHARSLDAIIARGTAPLAYLLYYMKNKNAPFIYHFASDPMEILCSSPKYRGLYGMFARASYGLEFWIQKSILKNNFAFASGKVLSDRLRNISNNVEDVVTSALSQEDYHKREDTCLTTPIRLLFVGYLRPEKRLDDLLRAMMHLVNEGYDLTLDVVGKGSIQNQLETLTAEIGLGNRILFHGYVNMGEPLNRIFNTADLFVFPSISEGSPKAVLEAMAHSLPVIATSAGNIPEMLDRGKRGILCQPMQPEQLTEGIRRMIHDSAFRRDCIREGFEFARQYSVESYVEQMANRVVELIRTWRKGK